MRIRLGLSHYLVILLAILIGGLSIYSSLNVGNPQVFDVSEDDDPVLGNPDAPVTLVEFSDYACSSCKAFQALLEQILADYQSTVKLVYRDFPFLTQNSQPAAEAAQCIYAQDPDLYWEFHDQLFDRQDEWRTSDNARAFFEAYAVGVAVPDLEGFIDCMDSAVYGQEVEADRADGERYGVTGTPTVFVNGLRLSGVPGYEELANAIEDALNSQGSS